MTLTLLQFLQCCLPLLVWHLFVSLGKIGIWFVSLAFLLLPLPLLLSVQKAEKSMVNFLDMVGRPLDKVHTI